MGLKRGAFEGRILSNMDPKSSSDSSAFEICSGRVLASTVGRECATVCELGGGEINARISTEVLMTIILPHAAVIGCHDLLPSLLSFRESALIQRHAAEVGLLTR